MTATATVPDAGDARVPARLRSRLWAHVAALAVLLAVAFPFMHANSSYTSDEGAYALQAEALQHGSWSYDYRAGRYDPRGDAFPLANSSRDRSTNGSTDGSTNRSTDGRRFYPYIQHPAYPELLRASTALLGRTAGMHAWALLGVALVAVAAWLLAREVDPRLSPWAFWLAALSPALVNGYLLWAHSLSAGVAGVAVVAAIRIVRRGWAPRRVATCGALLATGVLLRSEGLLFGMAVAAGVALSLSVPRRTAALRAALLAAPPLAAALLERVWVRGIVGGGYENFRVRVDGGGYLRGRVSGAWHDLVGGPILVFVALAMVAGFGFVALRRWDGRSHLAVALAAVVAVSLALAQLVRGPSDATSGLFTAAPVLLLGLLLVPWRSEGPAVKAAGVITALFAVAVVATEYGSGGGFEWGGRFFSPVLAPLAVLAAVGLDRRLAQARAAANPRRIAVAALASVVVAGAPVALLTVRDQRGAHAALMAAVARHPADVTITTIPAFPRVAWPVDRRVTWMLADDKNAVAALIGRLRRQGVRSIDVVTVASERPTPTAVSLHEPALDQVGLALFEITS